MIGVPDSLSWDDPMKFRMAPSVTRLEDDRLLASIELATKLVVE